ncbi:hypothetical protein ES703_27863 [subsurface metagenome]
MISLENYRDDLLRNIEESLDLIRTVNAIVSESGLQVNLTTAQRDFIVEWAFVRVHAAWESFLESCFIAYMLGVQSASGFAPVRYVFPNNEQHALDMILAGKEYFPWTAPDALRRQSVLCFQDGQPFRQILDETTTELQEMNTVRNAVVHKSRVAMEKFKSLVRDKMLTAPPDITPASFLLTARSGTAQRTFFSHYCNKLTVLANKVVPA